MGHHYLPRRLLRGFAQDGLIWMLDKSTASKPKNLPMARVAQEPSMYSEELEERLNNEIEQPFNAVLDRIDAGGSLESSDVQAIAHYVLTMFRRVPAGRARSKAAVPSVADAVEREHMNRISMLEQLSPDDHAIATAGRANIARIFERIRGESTNWLWHRTLLPENLPRITALLQQMTWEQWRAPPDRQILIGDSPVLFNESIGLVNARAKIVLPIRSDTVLLASWRPAQAKRSPYRELDLSQVRGINTRVVQRAARWVFFQRSERWVAPFVRRQRPY